MYIIHLIMGIYSFGLKRYAYKHMKCLHCDAPRLFVQTRVFAFAHLFWIPLIPLGYRYRWFCVACKREDHRAPLSFSFKLIMLLFLLGAMYATTTKEASVLITWLQAGIGILLLWSLYEIFIHLKTGKRKMYQNMLPLANHNQCVICDGELFTVTNNKFQCQSCECYALDVDMEKMVYKDSISST